MSSSMAEKLKRGDTVFSKNGPYEQEGQVLAVDPHHRSGFWVTFRWTDSKGRVRITRKRNCSVHINSQRTYGEGQ